MFNIQKMSQWDLMFSYNTANFYLIKNRNVLTNQERNYLYTLKKEIEAELYRRHYFLQSTL